MNKYYEVTAEIDGKTEVLYGSFLRSECTFELDCERISWKGQGYRKFKVITRDTAEMPDIEVYNLKHSTFYTVPNGQKRVYTTIKNTEHHTFLRNAYDGRTYQHDGNTPLYFVEGMPLDKPLEIIKEIK